jgi:hypothetical protein
VKTSSKPASITAKTWRRLLNFTSYEFSVHNCQLRGIEVHPSNEASHRCSDSSGHLSPSIITLLVLTTASSSTLNSADTTTGASPTTTSRPELCLRQQIV